MKKYTKIINKYSKENKRRNIYTNLGLILIYILFITLIGTVYLFNSVLKENAYRRNGNYTAVISNLNNTELEVIENNVEVKSYGVIRNVENSIIEGEKNKINLFSVDKNSMENLINNRIDLLDGSYPLGKNEVMITERAKTVFHKCIGEWININNRDYKIVGTYKIFHSEQPKIEAMTTDDKIGNFKKEKIYILVKLKSRKNVKKFVETVKKYNSNVGIKNNTAVAIYTKEKDILCKIIIMINIFCIYLIYGILSLKTVESKKDLAILRAIGCTKEKLVYMIFKCNLKKLVCASIVGSILGIIMLKILIAPIALTIIAKFGGVIKGVQVKGFYTIGLQIVLLSLIAIIISTYKLSKIKERKKVRKYKKIKGKNYEWILANKFMKENKGNRRIIFVAISIIIILFSMSTSLYYLAMKNNIINDNSGITLVKKYTNNGIEESNNVIDYIKGIQGIGQVRAVGIIELKALNLKRNSPIIMEKCSEDEKNEEVNNAQLIVCSDKNFNRIEEKIKNGKSDSNLKNSAILMQNNYSIRYGSEKDKYIEIKNENEVLKLNIVGSLETENLQESGEEKNIKKLRVLVSISTIENHNKLFKNNIDKVAISFNADKISEVNYYNIKNEALKTGMMFIDRTNESQQNKFFLNTSLFLSYVGIILISLIIISIVINNEYILIESRKKEFDTMGFLGMRKKQLKKILIFEGIIVWKEAIICGGGISIIGITIEFLYYRFKGNIMGVIPPYWIILIIAVVLLPISILSKLLTIKKLKLKVTDEK